MKAPLSHEAIPISVLTLVQAGAAGAEPTIFSTVGTRAGLTGAPLKESIIRWGNGQKTREYGSPPSDWAYQYATPGDYIVSLEVIDESGISATQFHQVQVP